MSGAPTPDVLKLIRVALTAGVLALGVVAFFLTNEGREPVSTDMAGTLQIAFSVFALAAVAGIAAMRSAVARAAPGKAGNYVIGAWAFGESPALFGGTIYLLTGNPLNYLIGVALLFIAFIMVPIPEQA